MEGGFLKSASAGEERRPPEPGSGFISSPSGLKPPERALGRTYETTSSLARVDPRILLVITLAYLLLLASQDRHRILPLIPLALYPLTLVRSGRITARALSMRVAAALPFLLVVALPAPFLDPTPLAVGAWIVPRGAFTALSLIGRGVLAVSTAVAIGIAVPAPRLVIGLRGLGCPDALTTQMILLLRFLNVLGAETRRTRLAARLRGLARVPMPRQAAMLLAALVLRSVNRAERLHVAMMIRGFTGCYPAAPLPGVRPRDWAWAGAWATFLIVVAVGVRP